MFVQRRRHQRNTSVVEPYSRASSTVVNHQHRISDEKQGLVRSLTATVASSTPKAITGDELIFAESWSQRGPPQSLVAEKVLHDLTSTDKAQRARGPIATGGKKWACRFCGRQLSSSSNRHRHERAKHPLEVFYQTSSTQGASRKHCTDAAFAAMSFETLSPPLIVEVRQGPSRLQPPDHTPIVSFDAAMPDIAPDSQPSASSSASVSPGDHQAGDVVEPPGSATNKTSESSPLIDLESDDATVVLERRQRASEPLCTQEDAKMETDHNQAICELNDTEGQQPPAAFEENHDMTTVEGVRVLLQEEDLQKACYSFLQWLASPPITQCEALVKARRIKSMSQLQPIKSNLRFIFALLYEHKAVDAIDLKVLLRLSTCQALYEAIVERQVGSGRIHAIFLLVKKVLVYMSTMDSTRSRQFVQPSSYESYMYVENICADSSHQRKQEARNRAVLGLAGGRGQLVQSRQVFQIPQTWSSPPSVSGGPSMANARQPAAPSSSNSVAVTAAAAAAAGATVAGVDQCIESFGKDELKVVTQACLIYLNNRVARIQLNAASGVASVDIAESDLEFVHYLVTATMCLGLAPRSQVLQHLRIGSSLVKGSDDRYWIKMLAEQSKNGKPTLFALARELTPAYDAYLQIVRPHMLARAAIDEHDYVFMKRNGTAPRTDFSLSTSLITQRIIGRPVNAHQFRSAIITAYYDTGASQADMDTLANIMAHDPATARNFYYKPKHSQAVVQTSERMVEQLLA